MSFVCCLGAARFFGGSRFVLLGGIVIALGIAGCAPEIRPSHPELPPEMVGSAEEGGDAETVATATASARVPEPTSRPTVEPPFTVEQIRQNVPVGTRWKFRTEFPNATPILREWTVTAVGEERVELDVVLVRGDERTTTHTGGRWEEWLRYELFETRTPTVTVEELDLAVGGQRCTVYTVVSARGADTVSARFAYAHAIPGPPVDVTMTVNGELLTRMTLVDFSRPSE